MLMEFDITTPPGRLMLGVVYDRLYRFFKEYDPRAEHDFIVQAILIKLINGEESVKLLLKVERGAVVGHILMSIEQDMGVPVVAINQAEFDTKVASEEEEEEWLTFVESFGLQHNAQRMVLITSRHPRVFEKRYGFKVHRTVMIKEIQTPQVVAGSNGVVH